MRVRLGTSSFSEPSWVGSFYPPGTRPAAFLELYALRFDALEVDASYYALPAARTVEGWRRRTPEGFTLALKVPRTVVHCGEGPRPDWSRLLRLECVGEELARFVALARLLGSKLGPLLVQLPWLAPELVAGPDEFLARLEPFLVGLVGLVGPAGRGAGGLAPDLRWALEVRNAAFLCEPLVALLGAHGVTLALADVARMPHPLDVARRIELPRTGLLYGRLIGDRKALERRAERFDRIVLDQGPRLERWVELLRELGPSVREAFVFANNHYAGHGPATALDLAARLRAAGVGEVSPAPEPAPEGARERGPAGAHDARASGGAPGAEGDGDARPPPSGR